jgi:hypothetical protein
MRAMHENMHEGASEKQRIGKKAQEVRAVFGDEIETGDKNEPEQDDVSARGGAVPFRVIMVHGSSSAFLASMNQEPLANGPTWRTTPRITIDKDSDSGGPHARKLLVCTSGPQPSHY